MGGEVSGGDGGSSGTGDVGGNSDDCRMVWQDSDCHYVPMVAVAVVLVVLL